MKPYTVLLGALVLGGCSTTTTPAYDARFGDAVRQAVQAAKVNPAPAPVVPESLGLDGKAAREAQERYHNSFREPPPTINVINIGGSSGGGR